MSNLTIRSEALKRVVQADLNAQKQAAEIALNHAKYIEGLLMHWPTEDDKYLEKARDVLLKIARMLTDNVGATSATMLDLVMDAAQ